MPPVPLAVDQDFRWLGRAGVAARAAGCERTHVATAAATAATVIAAASAAEVTAAPTGLAAEVAATLRRCSGEASGRASTACGRDCVPVGGGSRQANSRVASARAPSTAASTGDNDLISWSNTGGVEGITRQ